LAAALTDVCEIYTDVDGVFTSDRTWCRRRASSRASLEEMLEMAEPRRQGAADPLGQVRDALRHPLHVRSSFHDGEGTWVVREEDVMERLVVSGVTYNRNEAKIRVSGVKDVPGAAAKLFGPLSEAGIVVDMIVQNVSQDGSTDMTFTVPREEARRALSITEEVAPQLGSSRVEADAAIARLVADSA
jgi:aspartate kinase